MGIKLKIDGGGRIVLPKPVRERLGLRAGMDLEMVENPDGVELKPVRESPSMVRVNGFWVHQGAATAGFDWERFLEEEREVRHRQVLGL